MLYQFAKKIRKYVNIFLLVSLEQQFAKFSVFDKTTKRLKIEHYIFMISGYSGVALSISIFTDLTGSVIESRCPSVCLSVCLRHRMQLFSTPLIGPEIT